MFWKGGVVKKIIYSLLSLLIFTLIIGSAYADYTVFTWSQSRIDEDIRGWRLYYGVYEADLQEPPLNSESYQHMIELVAFDTMHVPHAPQTPSFQPELPPGLKVKPDKDNPASKWRVTYTIYLPPIGENEEYYIAATCYDFGENESVWSNIINFKALPLGQTGTPINLN